MSVLQSTCEGFWGLFNLDKVREILFLLPIAICIIVVLYIVYKSKKRILSVVFYGVLCIFIAPILIFVQAYIFLILGIFFEETLPSAYFHSLNAAVKIACFDDKTRQYCPHNLNQLYALMPNGEVREDIESGRFKITYQYYSQTNDYSIILRPVNSKFTDTLVAVFDSRLPKASNYKFFDFVDLRISKCFGNYSISNPPKMSGPWRNIN